MDEKDVLTNRQLGFEIKAANNMIRRKMEAIFAQQDGHELNGMQGPLLGYLYHKSRQGDVYQKDVEKEFRIRRSTATVMLQSLEQKGYLIRVASTEDARLKRILLTEKAIEHHNLIEEQIRIFNRELEAGLTEEEKATFLCILDKMMQNLGMDGECNVNGCSQQADHRYRGCKFRWSASDCHYRTGGNGADAPDLSSVFGFGRTFCSDYQEKQTDRQSQFRE